MFAENIKYEKTITMVTVECCNCGVVFGMPSDLKENLIKTRDSFYCPNGHGQSYSKSRADIIKEEYEQKLRSVQNVLANTTSEKIQLESQLQKSKNDLKRLKNGVCPCCNRSFKGLHEHIKKQHPEYKV